MNEVARISGLPAIRPGPPSAPVTAAQTVAVADQVELGSAPTKAPLIQRLTGKVSGWMRKLSGFTDETPLTAAVQTAAPAIAVGLLAAVLPQRAIYTADALAPGLVTKLINKGFQKADLEHGFGIDLQGAVQAVRLLNEHLAPVREDGHVRASALMEKLSQDQTPCFIHLGAEREEDARFLTMLVQGLKNTPDALPPVVKPELVPVFKHLMEQVKKGEFAAYIDLDGDLGPMNSTEKLACEQAASILHMKNNFGAGYKDGKQALRAAVAEMDTGAYDLPTLLRNTDPPTLEKLDRIKELLRYEEPEQNGFFWRVAHRHMQGVMDQLSGLHKSPERLADVIVSLDCDKVVGVQSYWARMLRSGNGGMQEEMLVGLSDCWARLSSRVDKVDFSLEAMARPDETPVIRVYDKEKDQVVLRPYDRGEMLTRVVDHTLCGLSPHLRPRLMKHLRLGLLKEREALLEREASLRTNFPGAYPGLDIIGLIQGKVDGNSPEVQAALKFFRENDKLMADNYAVSSDWGARRANFNRHFALVEWLAGADTRYGDPKFKPQSSDPGRIYGVSEFFDQTEVSFVDRARPVTGRRYGPKDGPPVMSVTIQLEGGGGKGLCYPGCLEALDEQLAMSPVALQVDGFAGTSAGALTALLLAAGFQGEELRKVMEELDTLKFNGDFMPLQGGRDPKARGLERTGLFSMQEMEKRLRKLLADKLDIHDRPITFKDLPFNLSLTSAVQATNLPQDDPLRQQIRDGRIVFSRENTPDFDVVGCALGSAAFPLFFQSPFLHVQRGSETSWIQLMDGGTISNLPLTPDAPEDQTMLLMLRANHHVEDVSLKTLAFDAPGIEKIDGSNREDYQKNLGGRVGELFDFAHKEMGVTRAMVAFNLATSEEQAAPVLQGYTRQRSELLVGVARKLGMTVMSADEGAEVVDSTLRQPLGTLPKLLANAFTDGSSDDNQLRLGLKWGGGVSAHYRIARTPSTRMEDVIGAATAAVVAAGEHFPSEQFEKIK